MAGRFHGPPTYIWQGKCPCPLQLFPWALRPCPRKMVGLWFPSLSPATSGGGASGSLLSPSSSPMYGFSSLNLRTAQILTDCFCLWNRPGAIRHALWVRKPDSRRVSHPRLRFHVPARGMVAPPGKHALPLRVRFSNGSAATNKLARSRLCFQGCDEAVASPGQSFNEL